MIRLHKSSLLFACASILTSAAIAAADNLPWDLSYQSALRDYPIPQNEFMATWPGRDSKRLIHEKLATYAGEKIEASLLIETPDRHAGDPMATWFIKTRTTAQSCIFHPKVSQPCEQLDPVRTEAFIREVMNLKPAKFSPSNRSIGDAAGGPIFANYFGFLSVYVDGRTLQRPIASVEFADLASGMKMTDSADAGRLTTAMEKVTLTPEEFQKRETEFRQLRLKLAIAEAARKGDIGKMRAFIEQGAEFEDAKYPDTPVIATAAAAGQTAAVDFLLERGAKIDAREGAALNAAVKARNVDMVEHLLSKGARLDFPGDSTFETPLGAAVGDGDLNMARLLIDRGADVNGSQSRPAIVTAALRQDLPMLDLLIAKGAKPDQLVRYENTTGLMMLVGFSGGGQRASSKTDAALELIVRKLVAAGANVNFINRACHNAYAEAKTRNSESMMRLLVELGADPTLDNRCRRGFTKSK
jgi:ankyrin repeat protein